MGIITSDLLRIIKVENVRSFQVQNCQRIKQGPQKQSEEQKQFFLAFRHAKEKCRFPLSGYKRGENKIIQISNIQRQNQKEKMLRHKPPQHKVFRLCQFISQGIDSRKTNQLIMKACQLGLPLSPTFTKQRYIYNIALAAITTMVEIREGFELAAIFLKDICVGKSYWDILHFLYEFKDQMLRVLIGGDQVIERIQVYNIAISHDLNTIYRCHCSLRNISHFYLTSNKKTNKVLPVEVSIPQPIFQKDYHANGRRNNEVVTIQDQALCSVSPNENQNRSHTLDIIKYQSVNDYIYLDADFVDLSRSQSDFFQQSCQSVVQVENKVFLNQSSSQILLKTQKKLNPSKNTNNENKFQLLLNQKLNQVGQSTINIQESDSSEDSDDVESISSSDFPRSKNSFKKTNKKEDIEVEPVNLNRYYEFLEQKYETIRENKTLPNLKQSQNHRLERCGLCLQLFHPFCQADQIFICNKCYLKQNSIKYRVINNLFSGYVHESSYLTLINFQCPNVTTAKAQYSETFIVELRYQYFKPPKQDNWNDDEPKVMKNFEEPVKKKQKRNNLNQSQVFFYLNYQPLPIKSVRENYEIQSVKIPLKYLQEKNTLVIQKVKTQRNRKQKAFAFAEQSRMLLGIYQVVPRSRRKQPINNTITRLSHSANHLFYQSVLRRNRLTSMRISNLSGASSLPMACPIRSYQCLHSTCFDFSEINITFSSQNTLRRPIYRKPIRNVENNHTFSSDKLQNVEPTSVRRIKRSQKIECPICGVDMKGLYLDTLMLESIQDQKEKKKGHYLEISMDQVKSGIPNADSQKISKEPIIVENFIQISQEKAESQILNNAKPAILFSDSDLSSEQSELKIMQKTTLTQKKLSYDINISLESQEHKAAIIIQSSEKSFEHGIQNIQQSFEIVDDDSGLIEDFYILVDQVQFTQEA